MKGSKYKDEFEQGKKAVNILGGKFVGCEEIKLPGQMMDARF